MKKQFEAVEQRASRHGVAVELVHEIDDFPAEAIVRAAKLKDCDLIVMSSHGRRGAARLLLGSQTAEVLAHTTIPVLVVR
jgi:nucleotide-binding universal stress UspA family protein